MRPGVPTRHVEAHNPVSRRHQTYYGHSGDVSGQGRTCVFAQSLRQDYADRLLDLNSDVFRKRLSLWNRQIVLD